MAKKLELEENKKLNIEFEDEDEVMLENINKYSIKNYSDQIVEIINTL